MFVRLVPLDKDDVRRRIGGQRVPDRLEADDDILEQNVACAGDLTAVFDQLPSLQPYATLTPAPSAQAERKQIRSCTTNVRRRHGV